MKRLYIIIPLLLIFTIQKGLAQVLPHTVSVGANLNFQDNSYDNNRAKITRVNLIPEVQYFYKENRAIVGGFTFSRSVHQSVNYTPVNESEYTWQVTRFNRGPYVGLRQHHPINDKIHVFTEFGFMYLQEGVRSKYVGVTPGPHYIGSSREDYSITGYANLGMMYFINKRFSLESTFVNARIQYSRPMNVDYPSKEWRFDLEGTSYVSFALRYYFRLSKMKE